ncbi:hypothetical protein [Bacillus sp. SBS7]|uniref:hypothetical protein n=1 Tax=Bacillus sp. SBS7 TaxID=3401756 RepID=UPI003AA97B55
METRYCSVTDLFKKIKLEIAEPNEFEQISIIVKLEPIKRSRQFNSYNKIVRNKIVYEYLFHSRTYRWLDENIIELNPDESFGYQAMGILHFIGLKDKHKGIFKGFSIQEAITMLGQQDSDFSLVIQSLHRYGKQENTNLDVEAESAASGYNQL